MHNHVLATINQFAGTGRRQMRIGVNVRRSLNEEPKLKHQLLSWRCSPWHMFTEKIRGGHANDQEEVRKVCSGSRVELVANLLGLTCQRDHPRA